MSKGVNAMMMAAAMFGGAGLGSFNNAIDRELNKEMSRRKDYCCGLPGCGIVSDKPYCGAAHARLHKELHKQIRRWLKEGRFCHSATMFRDFIELQAPDMDKEQVWKISTELEQMNWDGRCIRDKS